MKRYSIFLLFIVVTFFACSKTKNTPPTPVIAFVELSPNTVQNGSPKDTVNIFLRYTIAGDQLSNDMFIYYIDSRIDTVINDIPFPADIELRKEEEDGTVHGNINLRFEASRFLVARPTHLKGDTLNYEIYIQSVKGTDTIESNKVRTSDIYIVP